MGAAIFSMVIKPGNGKWFLEGENHVAEIMKGD
jgi:hypothetical protein